LRVLFTTGKKNVFDFSDPDQIRVQLILWVQEDYNYPKIGEKLRNFMFRSAGGHFGGTGGFSCSLNADQGGLSTKIPHFFKFFTFFVLKSLNPDPDPDSQKKPGSVYRFRIRIQNIVFEVYSAPAGTLEEEHARRSCPTQARPVTSPDQTDAFFYEHVLQIKKSL
jgi:hypothetical protein